MVSGSLFEVTVYIGLMCIAYSLPSLWERDGQYTRKLLDFGESDLAMHHAEAVRTNRLQIPNLARDGMTVGHRARWHLRQATSEAIQLPELAGVFVIHATSF
jgi:hypothetical protein